MARWEPNALERLQAAAMELFRERGYDGTTAREIAAHAGLTERTFFRYFADKREVLFGGSERLKALVVEAMHTAPTGTEPLAVVLRGLEATCPMFESRRAFAAIRHRLIVAHPELHERELVKLASLGQAIAASLVERGTPAPMAGLVAEMGLGVFKNAFERWVDDRGQDLVGHLSEAVGDLRRAVGGADAKRETREPVPAPKRAAARGIRRRS